MPTQNKRTESSAKKQSKRRSDSWIGYVIFGSVILLATLALVIFGRFEETWQTFAILVSGIALGTWLFRFGSRHAWVTFLCLFSSLATCVVLGSTINSIAGVAWMGGFVAGTNFGAAWRATGTRRKAEIIAPRA